MATEQELLAAVAAMQKGTATAAQLSALKQVWGTAYDAKIAQYGPTSEAGLLAATAAIKAGVALTPAQQSALRGVWGAAYEDKVRQYSPAGSTPQPGFSTMPIAPQPTPTAPKGATLPPATAPGTGGGYTPAPPASATPAPVTPQPYTEQELLAAVSAMQQGKATPEQTAALRQTWGTAYDAKVLQYGPTSEAGLLAATAVIKAGGQLTPAQEAALRGVWKEAYDDKVRQYSPVATTPGTTPAPNLNPGGYTPSPMPNQTDIPIPTQTNYNGLDSTQYPQWLTDIMADPVKMADPKNAAAINNYLVLIGDKRTGAQWMTENAWRVGQDTFNMNMQVRQQKMAEWQAKEQANQSAAQLALDTQTQQGQNANQATSNANQLAIGMGNIAVGHESNANQLAIGQGNIANDATSNANQLAIGQGNIANNATANANALTLGQGNIANDATGHANTLQLGLGNLAFKDTELKTNAELERENQANQLTQSRYSAFGRSQAPNTRSLRSWG